MELDAESAEWQLASFEWLLRNGGGYEKFRKGRVVLPSHEFFPEDLFKGEDIGVRVFEKIKYHMGMSKWPCRLEVYEDRDPLAAVFEDIPHSRAPQNSPKGFFEIDKETKEVIISYGKSNLEDAYDLITTLTHELCHYLLSTKRTAPPGGWDVHEYLTDLTCVFKGFGVFLSHAVFKFETTKGNFTHGWRSKSAGYLNKAEICNAMTLHLLLHELPLSHIEPHLEKVARTMVRECYESNKVKHAARIASMREIVAAAPERPNAEKIAAETAVGERALAADAAGAESEADDMNGADDSGDADTGAGASTNTLADGGNGQTTDKDGHGH